MNRNSKLTEKQKKLTYRSIFKDSCESKFLIDRAGTILDANDAFCERIGKAPHECHGMNIFSLLPPDVAARRKKYMDEVFRTGKQVYFEDENKGQYLRSSIYPISGDNGDIEILYILVQNITEIKLNEQKNKKYAAISQEVMDAFPGAFTILDSTGKIISCNSYFRNIIAKSKDDNLSGINTFELFHPDDIAPLNEKLNNIIKKWRGRNCRSENSAAWGPGISLVQNNHKTYYY